jgi:hypothetical protein
MLEAEAEAHRHGWWLLEAEAEADRNWNLEATRHWLAGQLDRYISLHGSKSNLGNDSLGLALVLT